jgi:hypothetical protein
MTELSVLIPARNEQWLPQTVADLFAHAEGDTEVIVVLDGFQISLGAHGPRLKTIVLDNPIGQRAAQNLAARHATGKYVMKVDAHCAFDQGFDVKLMAAMSDDVTLVPTMRNLHVFDWVCDFCGYRRYQGPQPESCPECNADAGHFQQDVVWIPKTNPASSAYRFNKLLRFKYFPELQKQQGKTGLQETMSLQGSCFMATRAAYWERELCDESWGSWGQQGSEVALKTWLSGGRVLCLRDTWYAHLFRTQTGFGFPYPMSGQSQDKARAICQDIFLNDKWPKQTRPLAWLLERFWEPLAQVGDKEDRWEQADLDRLRRRGFKGASLAPSKGIIYYTDNALDEAIAAPVRERLAAISADKSLPITSASLKRMTFGVKNVWLHSHTRGVLTMFTQILAALENSRADIIFFAEHDVLYHASHFDFTPPDRSKVYYNLHWWQVRTSDGHAATWDAKRVSQLCGYRDVLIDHYRKRVALVTANGYSTSIGYEPGSHGRAGRVDDLQSDVWRSEFSNIDLKHGGNLTPGKWSLADFRTAPTGWAEADAVPGWPSLVELLGVPA